MVKKQFYKCDLCDQPVKVTGFTGNFPDGLKRFCCEGCLQIFKLLEPKSPSNQNKENIL